MDALLDQIKSKAAAVDETGRRVILGKLRDLAYSIEAPEDTMQRILYQVSEVWKQSPASNILQSSLWSLINCLFFQGSVIKYWPLRQNLQIAVIKIGVDLKIFNSLAESSKALNVEQLTETHHVDPLLLSKLQA